jgi:hypothetical protein
VPDEIVKAVHALHDYYISQGIQYDDGTVRNQVMSGWGYSIVVHQAGNRYLEKGLAPDSMPPPASAGRLPTASGL